MLGSQVSSDCSHRNSKNKREFHMRPVSLFGRANNCVNNGCACKNNGHDYRYIGW